MAGCCILAFCIPFPFIYSTLGIWLLAAIWLFAADHRQTLRNLAATRYYWIWISYFALFAISYFYSDNKSEAAFDTVSKLSFVLLPFLAGAGMRLSRSDVGRILIAFATGLIVTGLYCLLQAWTGYRQDGNSDHFFYHQLVKGLEANAVYMAWYVVSAIASLLLFPWADAGLQKVTRFRWPVLAFLSAFLLLLAGRLLIAYCSLVVIPAFLFSTLWRRRHRGLLIGAILTLACTLGLLLSTNNPVRKRFGEIMHPDMSVVTTNNFQGIEPNWTNLTARLFIWRAGLENVCDNRLWLFGAGNGDVHELQNKRFAQHGLLGMDASAPVHGSLYNINLHNMYLQSLIAIGLPGLVCLLLILFVPIVAARRSDWGLLTWVFFLGSALFMLQEAALQTQAGVVFFSFFAVILWHGVKNQPDAQKAGKQLIM